MYFIVLVNYGPKPSFLTLSKKGLIKRVSTLWTHQAKPKILSGHKAVAFGGFCYTRFCVVFMSECRNQATLVLCCASVLRLPNHCWCWSPRPVCKCAVCLMWRIWGGISSSNCTIFLLDFFFCHACASDAQFKLSAALWPKCCTPLVLQLLIQTNICISFCVNDTMTLFLNCTLFSFKDICFKTAIVQNK